MGGGEPNTDVGFTNPVIISGLTVTPSAGQCVIAWTTNIAASDQLKWGKAPNMDQTTAENNQSPNMVTSHSITISGLTAGKTYKFLAISRQNTGKDGLNNTVMDGYQATYYGEFGAV